MKRIVAAFAAILLLSCVCIFAVGASGTVTASTQISVDTAKPGDTFTVKVVLEDAAVLKSGSVEVQFDDTVLQLLNGKWKLEGDAEIKNFITANKQGVFAYGAPDEYDPEVGPQENEGAIFTATFKVLDTATGGPTEVKIVLNLEADDGTKYDVTNVADTLTITGTECTHSFTAQTVSEERLASAATCVAPAKYYYSCANCGEQGTETFESGEKNATNHTKTTYTYEALEGNIHNKKHECCGEIAVGNELCSGGTATCTEPATCQYCSEPYGNTKDHEYTEQKATNDYLLTPATCQAEAVYLYSCSCGAVGTETFKYGEKDGSNHTKGTVYASNNNGTHDKKYECCGAVELDNEACTGGTATCNEQPVCQYCNVKYGTIADHKYNQEVAAEAYLATPATCEAEATYYYSCSCGDKGTETFKHGEKDGSNHTKNTFVYVSNHDDTHDKKYECCGAVEVDNEKCSGGTATCTAKAVCQSCNEVYGKTLDHEYTVPQSDDHDHWNKCAHCDATDTKVPHTFNQEIVDDAYLSDPATCVSPAKYYYSCSCGAKGDETFEHGYVTGSHTGTQYYKSNGDDTHTLCYTCCDAPVADPEPCSGGTPACGEKAICQYCQTAYGEEKHINEYTYCQSDDNGKTHGIYCGTCEGLIETENCYGGVADCKTQANCDACYQYYGELDMTEHVSTNYLYESNYDNTHDKKHACCGTVEVAGEACSGGTATCTEQKLCTSCQAYYGELAGCVFSPDGVITTPTESVKGCITYSCTNPECEKTDVDYLTGLQELNGYFYYMDEDSYAVVGLVKIGEYYYYFQEPGEADRNHEFETYTMVYDVPETGKDYWLYVTNGLDLPQWGYHFDSEGRIITEKDTSFTGLAVDGNGKLSYFVDGVRAYMGLIKIGQDVYYIRSNGEAAVNCTYYCTKNNGLMESAKYAFDAEGKMTGDLKNGIYEEGGKAYYYVNNVKTYGGLVKIGEDYYYVNSKCEVIRDQNYCITWARYGFVQGWYEFDADGKLVGPSKNGFVEEGDKTYYYVNGTKTYGGLMKIGEDYYYVNSKCEVIRGQEYTITWTHGLLPQDTYTFDQDGKIVFDAE